MDITVNTTQIDALRDFFDGLSSADQRKIFLTAFRKVAKPIIAEAKATVPRKTGNLARSIGSIAVANEAAILVGAKKSGGYKGWHGHLIENGTVNRFRKTKKNAATGRIIGTHFFENAYNNNEHFITQYTEEEILQAIDKLIVKINKR